MFQPVNIHRLQLLNALEAGGRIPTVEEILNALFRPMLDVVSRPTDGGWFFPRLLAFCLTEPGAYLKPLVEEEFALKTRRFHTALHRACPGLSLAEVRWRLHFSLGAFIHTAGNPQLLEITSEGLCEATDPEAVLKRIVGFCAAGFKVETVDEQR
jgi:hypothetical protein